MPKLCASMATMSASAGGRTIPSETPSATATTASASTACASFAIRATGSSTPKKFGDCTTTAAASCSALSAAASAQRRIYLARR